MSDGVREFVGVEPDIEIRSESEREVAVRFTRWGEVALTPQGRERLERGVFDEAIPGDVVLRMEHEGPPAGRGIRFEDSDIGQVGIFRAARTARGDELMTLAQERYFRGASPMFTEVQGGTIIEGRGDNRTIVHKRADLREVSLTWRPAYRGTEVLYARADNGEAESMSEENGNVSEEITTEREATEPTVSLADWQDYRTRVEQLEARSTHRSTIAEQLAPAKPRPTSAIVPVAAPEMPYRGLWMQAALTLMDGQALTPMHERVLADIVAADNAGFVPTAYVDDLVGIIDPARRFMSSTRRIDMPSDGLEISYPRIVTRPTVGEQLTEKAEVTSTAVETDRATAPVRTFAGAGDLSLQLLRRSSPQFLNFYLELLAEAYAKTTENAAVVAWLASGLTAGSGAFDAAATGFGAAFTNAQAAGLAPDTIWLSTEGLVEFMDAREPAGGGGRLLYPGLSVIDGMVAVSPGGSDIGIRLRPVWVPALDGKTISATDVDVVIGPSRGFAWAEDGTFTLQADVPGRLGRDVALAGFAAFLPLYPAAFTYYAV